MKNFVALVLLAIWLTFGAWYYTCKVKELCGTTSTEVQVTKEKDPFLTKLKYAYQCIFLLEEAPLFQFGDSNVHTNSSFDACVEKVTLFLKEHPSVNLTISGLYSREEGDAEIAKAMGTSRGAALKAIFIDTGIGEGRLSIQEVLDDSLFVYERQKEILNFTFSDDFQDLNNLDVKSAFRGIDFLENTIHFYKDEEIVRLPKKPVDAIVNIGYYLNKNKVHNLQVVIPFSTTEIEREGSPNIGLMRAYDLKQQLIDFGLEEERILIESIARDSLFDESNYSLPKSIAINFVLPDNLDSIKQKELDLELALAELLTEQTATEEEVEQNDTESLTPMKFGYASHKVRVNKEVIDYVKELSSFLNEYPNKEVIIIGHTDNIGSNGYNYELGRIRGYSARNLLINYRISPKKIRIESEGESKPIASNDSSGGRRKNRRVEIDIK